MAGLWGMIGGVDPVPLDKAPVVRLSPESPDIPTAYR